MVSSNINNEYQRLLKIIEDYEKREDVVTTDQIISLYNLYILMSNRLHELQFFNDNGCKTLKGKVNKYKSPFGHVLHLFNKKVYVPKFRTCDIKYYFNENSIMIKFGTVVESIYLSNQVYCDHESKRIYFSNNDMSDMLDFEHFIEANHDVIKNAFDILDDVFSFFKSDTYKSQKIVDDFFTCSLNYNYLGKVDVDLSVSKEHDPRSVYNISFLDSPSLNRIVAEKSDVILRKIPVSIEKLDCDCQEIFKEELGKYQNPPQYVKKI